MPLPTFSTAETILTQVRAETGIGSSPKSTALQNTAMLRTLHDCNHNAVNAPYEAGVLGFKFMIEETIIQTKAATTLNGGISSGAASLILTDASDFDDPAGANVSGFYIKNGKSIYDFGVYEDKSSNTLSMASGIQIDHLTLEAVHKIYRLPSNFDRVRAMFRQSNVSMYEWQDSELTQVPYFPYFMVKNFTSTNSYSASFLVFPENITATDWKLYYAKLPTSITATDSVVNLPDGAGRRYLVHKMNAYVYSVLWETALQQQHEQMAAIEMDKLLTQWVMPHITPNRSLSFNF